MKITDIITESQLTEIERLSKDDYTGGKGELDNYKTPRNKTLKPLPGGSGLQYAITPGKGYNSNSTFIFIVNPQAVNTTNKPTKHRYEFDNEYAKRLRDWEKREGRPGPMVIAKLNVYKSDIPIPNAVQVGSITVDEDYRGQGLAKALYGIVLSIMGKTLVAGGEQTPGGRRNWLSLVSIPGVEVKGFIQFDSEEITFRRSDWPTGGDWDQRAKESEREVDKLHNTLMKLGGQFVAKDRYSEYWAFDVVPGRAELQPAVKTSLSQIYDSGDAAVGLYARWTGK